MTTLEMVEEKHKEKPDHEKDFATFAAMCATCGPKFTFWFYGIAIVITLLLYLYFCL